MTNQSSFQSRSNAISLKKRDENWNDAKLAARNFTEDQIPQVLAAMVNLPPIPADKDALEWLPRVQLCTAQVIAHIGTGWQSSARREELLSAHFGPRDWITVAAIIALAHLAEENREIEADVHDGFMNLRRATIVLNTRCLPAGNGCRVSQGKKSVASTSGCWISKKTDNSARHPRPQE